MTTTNQSTIESLPVLEDTYCLSHEEIDRFRRDGHLITRGLASPEEVEAYRLIIAEAVEKRKDTARGGTYAVDLKDRDTREKAFLQMENLWSDHAGIARFSLARRFAGVAARLLGVDAVRIYHDQALFKEPGGGYTPWHQDQYYWPIDTRNTATVWIPLLEMGAEMGTLIFADGLYHDGPMVDLAISDHSEAAFKRILREKNARLAINELNAGDATWHFGWTPHKAPGNVTDRMRQAMTIIYVADGARVIAPRNQAQASDLAKWLPGCQPGDLVDSKLNPIVWSRFPETVEQRFIPFAFETPVGLARAVNQVVSYH